MAGAGSAGGVESGEADPELVVSAAGVEFDDVAVGAGEVAATGLT